MSDPFTAGLDEDPAADFLAREQQELAGLEDDGFGGLAPDAAAATESNQGNPVDSGDGLDLFGKERVSSKTHAPVPDFFSDADLFAPVADVPIIALTESTDDPVLATAEDSLFAPVQNQFIAPTEDSLITSIDGLDLFGKELVSSKIHAPVPDFFSDADLFAPVADVPIIALTESTDYPVLATAGDSLFAPVQNQFIAPTEDSLITSIEDSLITPAGASLLEPAEDSLIAPAGGSLLAPAEDSLIAPAEVSLLTAEDSLVAPAEDSLVAPAEVSLFAPAEDSLIALEDDSLVAPGEGSLFVPAKDSLSAPAEDSIIAPAVYSLIASAENSPNILAEESPIASPQVPVVALAEDSLIAPAVYSLIASAEDSLIAPAEESPIASPEVPVVAPAKDSLIAPAKGSLIAPAENSLIAPAEVPVVAPAEDSLIAPAEVPVIAPAEDSAANPLPASDGGEIRGIDGLLDPLAYPSSGDKVHDGFGFFSAVDKEINGEDSPSESEVAPTQKTLLWREEQLKKIADKDKNEEVKLEEWRNTAKRELEEWYARQAEQVEKHKKNNRVAEAEFVKERDETTPGNEWERISRLCDFNPKNNKNTKDVSKLRSLLLQLKQNPVARSSTT